MRSRKNGGVIGAPNDITPFQKNGVYGYDEIALAKNQATPIPIKSDGVAISPALPTGPYPSK